MTNSRSTLKHPPLSLIEGLADARKLPAELLLALADIDRRTADRRDTRQRTGGRRAEDATPAEIDRATRAAAAADTNGQRYRA